MVIKLSFVCFWQLQVYLQSKATFCVIYNLAKLSNRIVFYFLIAIMNFSYYCLFYGLGKIAKDAYLAKVQNFGFSCLLGFHHALSCRKLNVKKDLDLKNTS